MTDILEQLVTRVTKLEKQVKKNKRSPMLLSGDGIPAETASESVMYWDYTDDDLYVNSDGAATWQLVGGGGGGFNHNFLSATHPDTLASAVSRGSIVVGNATPLYAEVVHPGGAGYALITDANDVVWDQTPQWTGDHNWISSVSAKPVLTVENTNADGSAPTFDFYKNSASPANNDDLGAWDFFGNTSTGAKERYAYFFVESLDVTNGDTGGGMQFRVVMNAVERTLIDVAGYNGSVNEGEVIINQDAQDVDFRVEAVGVADALEVQGSDGQITLGALGAGFAQSTAGGILSSAAIIVGDLPSHTHSGAGDGGSLATGTTTLTGTQGSIPFIGAANVVEQDNANLFYDAAQDYFGLGINAALAARLHVVVDTTTAPAAIFQTSDDNTTENLYECRDSADNVLSGSDARGILFSDGDTVDTNFFAGKESGRADATGANNVGVGANALDALTSGAGNVCAGASAGSLITESNNNVCLGYLAGASISTGSGGNTLVGRFSGVQITIGILNTCIGSGSGAAITTGGSNTIVGAGAGGGITTASNAALFGRNAGLMITTGQSNVCIGSFSGDAIVDGDTNVCVGLHAGGSNISGQSNTLMGDTAGFTITGNTNTALGYFAAYDVAAGSGNIHIGYDVRGVAGESNKLYVHNSDAPTASLVYGEFDNLRIGFGGVSTLSATVHIGQTNAAASVPALWTVQTDVSEQHWHLALPALAVDQDIRILTIGVDGAPEFGWLEVADVFNLSHGLTIAAGALTISALGAGFVRTDANGVFSSSALIAGDLPIHGSTHDVGAGDPVTTTNDGATNHSRILASSAAGAITMDDYFTVDGGTFGIAGNELLTVNAAGTFVFSGASVGIRGTPAAVADGLYVPWIAGDALPTARFGSTNVSNDQIAVYGDSYSQSAIYGISNSGAGVDGRSNTGFGVSAICETGYGLVANLIGLGSAIAEFRDFHIPVLTIQDGGQSDFAEYIRHLGDTDTYLRFQSDNITLRAGGVDMVDIVETATDYVNFPAGLVFINETANTFMTQGLTLNQGANDDEIAAFKSSDVAHGITDITETDTYGLLQKSGATTGGLVIGGFGEATVGLNMRAYYTNDTTTQSSTAVGAVIIRALKKSGTGTGNIASGQNILNVQGVIGGVNRNVAIFNEDGDLYLDTIANENAWDDYDDVGLLHGLRASLSPTGSELRERFGEWIEYARPVLERSGIVTYNDDGHNFVAVKQLQMLTIDAVRQLYEKCQRYELALQNAGLLPA